MLLYIPTKGDKIMKPIIGVVEWPYVDKDEDVIFEVPTPICNKIIEHGGIPVGLFPTISADFQSREIPELEQSEIYDLHRIISQCDAIIKPGAIRIYNYERLIYDYAVCQDMPFLGICAGMQLMAHYGKSKISHNIRNTSNINHHQKETYAHEIFIEQGSLLSKVLDKPVVLVNSKHNYHIQDSGILKTSAHSFDGYIEAIENPKCTFQLGVQWHPELIQDENSDKLFDTFIESAKRYTLK